MIAINQAMVPIQETNSRFEKRPECSFCLKNKSRLKQSKEVGLALFHICAKKILSGILISLTDRQIQVWKWVRREVNFIGPSATAGHKNANGNK